MSAISILIELEVDKRSKIKILTRTRWDEEKVICMSQVATLNLKSEQRHDHWLVSLPFFLSPKGQGGYKTHLTFTKSDRVLVDSIHLLSFTVLPSITFIKTAYKNYLLSIHWAAMLRKRFYKSRTRKHSIANEAKIVVVGGMNVM